MTPGGTVLGVTISAGDKITIEVHDSGPGVSLQARSSLFQPSISFKRGGMGLGLSIARKSALLAGGDILLVPGELGGAAFRVLLPVAYVRPAYRLLTRRLGSARLAVTVRERFRIQP